MTTPLPQLNRNRECVRCPLYEDAINVCVPTTLYGMEKRHDRAILIIGEAPGASEDKADQPFIGRAGNTLRTLYIDFFKLSKKADVWLGNAARCHPPGNKTPSKTILKSCHGFLLADVHRLQQEYNEVLILCVGGPAALAILGSSLRASFRRQGEFTDFTNLLKGQKKYEDIAKSIFGVIPDLYPKPCRVFCTYHPSFLNREPSAGLSVKAHIQMLSDYLDGNLKYELPDLLEIEIAARPPVYHINRLSLDIETYGIIKTQPIQTMFHPTKSLKWDNVSLRNLVQTVGLSWRDPQGILRHTIFHMDKVPHRRRLWNWLRKIKSDPKFEYLIGQNIQFDLLYLRAAFAGARVHLQDPLPIFDLIILNYLHDESRPEKSLKALAPLFRIATYVDGFTRYNSNTDPLLAQYNCKDTASTLLIAERLESEIRGFYGKDTQKLSEFCMSWYSDLLWLIIWMSEAGLRMDTPKLQALFTRYSKAFKKIEGYVGAVHEIPMRGKGSELGKRNAMLAAAEAVGNWGDLDLKLTDTKHEISFCVANRNALMKVLPRESEPRQLLKLIGSYQDVSGMLDRYLYPMLVGRGKTHDIKSSVLVDDTLYASWYCVPSEYEDKQQGGTKQSRIVAKGPALQTFPPVIKKCIKCRFPRGHLLWFDYSQIELVTAALLSGDPAMMAEYEGNPDLHGKTAKLMFGDDIVNHPRYKSKYRQAGKVFNFRALFRGGAQTAQTGLMKDLGILLELDQIREIDQKFWIRHRRLREWQDELCAFVRKHNYYELPLIGQSRLFLGGKRAKDKAINEIVNLPVQATAANIMLSAQFALWQTFREHGLQAILPCNIYDAAPIECGRHELYRVEQLMSRILPSPPFYQALCRELGRTLPLRYEITKG